MGSHDIENKEPMTIAPRRMLLAWLADYTFGATVVPAVIAASNTVNTTRQGAAPARRPAIRTPYVRARNLRDVEGTRSNLG